LIRDFSQRIKYSFENLEEAIEDLGKVVRCAWRAYNTARDIYKRCRSYRQPKEVCKEISSEVIKRYYASSLDTLLNSPILDKVYKRMLKDAIALDGPKIAKYIHSILKEFSTYGGIDYEKEIVPHIFQVFAPFDDSLATGHYERAKRTLNYAKNQLFIFYNYLKRLPPQIKKIAIKAIIREIERSGRLFYPNELIKIAEQAIMESQFKRYK